MKYDSTDMLLLTLLIRIKNKYMVNISFIVTNTEKYEKHMLQCKKKSSVVTINNSVTVAE